MIAKRSLGNTDMEVSILGLGTVKLGRNEAVKYPQGFALPDDKQASDLLALARERGINLIDTAPAYGTSEERLGHLLRGQRQDWLICTKVGEDFVEGISSYDFSPEHVRFSIERSLQRLNTEVLDIVLVHSDGNDVDIIKHLGTLDALAELKRQGKLRAFGMSTKTVEGGLLAAQQSDVVMLTWNLQHQEEVPVIDYCQEHGVGVLIKKALASGHLAGAELSRTELPRAKLSGGKHSDQNPTQQNRAFDSLAMITAHPGVSSAIVGTINPEHLLANINSVC
ncbi:MAG: aldo/keto reductase [Porticoccaceae bacterium]|nr:aldo/keto reductase [Porticoccaceae bacterium]